MVAALTLSVAAFWAIRGDAWTRADYPVLDRLYRSAVADGKGPPRSDRIVYLAITDETYDRFGGNTLLRSQLARVNDALAALSVEAVVYDIIFARPSTPDADRVFARSLASLGVAYLPIGLQASRERRPFQWAETPAYRGLRSEFVRTVTESGVFNGFYAERALMQMGAFSAASRGTGHINAHSDPDGVYRHQVILLRIDDQFIPSLSLAVFLDFIRVPLESVHVDWGRRIVIPADASPWIDRDVVIPIDDSGRTFIPYPNVWGEDFPVFSAHKLLEYASDPDLRGNLAEQFEGRLVLFGDVSAGVSDLGTTPLEENAPLLVTHAAVLNGLLTNHFYRPWSTAAALALLTGACALFALAGWLRSDLALYGIGLCLILAIVAFAWHQIVHASLFPVVSVTASAMAVFVGGVAGLQLMVSRQRSFIQSAFSRYVPRTVVDRLIEAPERLQLGGEEREMTVLFSDLAEFTALSESMQPSEVVQLLHEYLTEMTAQVLAEEGIVDKYLGDAIMAEFGAPIPVADHADRAVRTALNMQRRLADLRRLWAAKGLPELTCRIGVNTGIMIVGNMGSDQVFDYTVIGDAVNLASRLESANKFYGTDIMISEATHRQLTPDRFRTRLLDSIRVKGKTQPIRVYEVYGSADEPAEDAVMQRYHAAYGEGITAFFARDFAAASAAFGRALVLRPDDPAATALLARIEANDSARLPDDWDGSRKLDSK